MSPPASPRAGLVLAGGYSTRFGDHDKAFADLHGGPLLGHVVGRLGRVVDGVLVNCRTEQVPRIRRAFQGRGVGVAIVPDPVPDRGPAAGVAVGLAACRVDYTAVVACDHPLVDPTFLDYLFERARGHSGAVPRVGGRLQPTQAVYRTTAMARACEAALHDGDGSLAAAVDALDPAVVPEAEVLGRADRRTFLDVNTRDDLRRVRETAEE